jgi:ubiquinone/menaquinone biosynthesis C-methylase UbiE
MSDRQRANRAHWNAISERYQAAHDPHIGKRPMLWGGWAVADEDLGGVLGDLTGLHVLELGCGAGQWARSIAADDRYVVGLDQSEAQLASAQRSAPNLPLVHANGEELPFLPGTFDVVFCDHGAMSWADPYRTVPEVSRVLRSGGRLVFNASSPWLAVCYDDERDAITSTLRHSYFDLHALPEENGATSYTLPYGAWIRLFRANALVVDNLIEIRPAAGVQSSYYTTDPSDWHARWPAETLWVTRRE